jgi:hypothetical protein
MGTKISALPAASALTGTELVPVVQGGATVQTTPTALRAFCGVGKFTANIGDGTNVSYTVNHALGTRDVMVKIYRNATPYDEPIVETQHTDANNVTFVFTTAPTTNQFRVVIWA